MKLFFTARREDTKAAGEGLYYQLVKFLFLPLVLSNRYLELSVQFWLSPDYLSLGLCQTVKSLWHWGLHSQYSLGKEFKYISH